MIAARCLRPSPQPSPARGRGGKDGPLPVTALSTRASPSPSRCAGPSLAPGSGEMAWVRGRLVASLLTLLALLAAAALAPAALADNQFNAGGVRINVPRQSMAELKFTNVVHQAHDVSCGAAALATIFQYFYDETISEQDIIDGMNGIGDIEKIQRDGFSMLELKRFAEANGYVSAGYRIEEAANLRKLTVPAIALVSTRGYNHFVVLKQVRGDKVFIADPAFGNRVRSLEEFESQWNNVVLLVLSPTKDGEAKFSFEGGVTAPIANISSLLNRPRTVLPTFFGEF